MVEVLVAMVVLLVGLLAALSWAIFRLSKLDLQFAKLVENLAPPVPSRSAKLDLAELQTNPAKAEALASTLVERSDALAISLRHMAGNIAHELGTPLAHALRHFEENSPGNPNFDEQHAVLGDRLFALQLTFSALLDIVQIESGNTIKTEVFDLADAVREAVILYESTAQENNVSLEAELSEAQLVGNYWLLVQAVSNLLSNAIRFSTEGASVIVKTDMIGTQPVLSVGDNGPGVPDANIDALLARVAVRDVEQASASHGLGLRLVRAIFMRHGARVRMQKNEPTGLKWTVGFPAISANSQ